MIDIRKLKELVRLMVSNELTELDLRDSEEQVTLRRHTVGAPMATVAAPVATMTAVAPSSAAVAEAPPTGASPAAAGEEEGLVAISSPMVGTFYSGADPDSPPFVSVGTSLGPDTTVCILEAMKIFNEIKAECVGTVEKVLVQNGDSVEFGQSLFLVKPA